MKIHCLWIVLLMGLNACRQAPPQDEKSVEKPSYSLMILGVAQDGGYPQNNCSKICCSHYAAGTVAEKWPACLVLTDLKNQQVYLFEATPAYPQQWRFWQKNNPELQKAHPDAIFITHAHMGHYTGLMYLGREVEGTTHLPVFVLPRLYQFLLNNGPWSQLVALDNIALTKMQADSAIGLANDVSVIPLLVPHRDEYSETAGFNIQAGGKKILFIPDIDKWNLWNKDICKAIEDCDMAFLDATFYKNGELKRDMSEIPHPFVEESMQLFNKLSLENKSKVHFIHFNHTNPLIWDKSKQLEVTHEGFFISQQGAEFKW